MNHIDQPVREVARKVRAEVSRAVLAQTARDKDLGMAVGERELDVRVSFVVAQQDVEARLPLLDEVVLERERFVFVGNRDVVDIDGLAHQRAGLGVRLRGCEEVTAHPGPQVLGLADVDDIALGVLVEEQPGPVGRVRIFCWRSMAKMPSAC